MCKTRPWGQGPVFAQQLALLNGFDLESMGRAEFIHTVIECAKLAFADREAWYGDTDVPVKTLLSADYASARRRLVGPQASGDLRPGAPDGRPPRLPSTRMRIPHTAAVPATLRAISRAITHRRATRASSTRATATPYDPAS